MNDTLLKERQQLVTGNGSFDSSARSVLRFLRERLDFDLWMITRTAGEDWIVLQSEDSGYGVKANQVFRWTDSFCSRMVEGKGPRVAPVATAVPAYAAAPIAQAVPIAAYIGVPITAAGGELFGTLCAIDPSPKPDKIGAELPLVELLASMLSSILEHELNAAAARRLAERAKSDAEIEVMTGLYNRRGWERLLDAEESRCALYGHPAFVLSIDLDGLKTLNDTQGHGAGDALICRAGAAIQAVLRSADVGARVGGDEFAVLGVESGIQGGRQLGLRIRSSLQDAGVKASIGMAMREPGIGLRSAWAQADGLMYMDKKSRKVQETAV